MTEVHHVGILRPVCGFLGKQTGHYHNDLLLANTFTHTTPPTCLVNEFLSSTGLNSGGSERGISHSCLKVGFTETVL